MISNLPNGLAYEYGENDLPECPEECSCESCREADREWQEELARRAAVGRADAV